MDCEEDRRGNRKAKDKEVIESVMERYSMAWQGREGKGKKREAREEQSKRWQRRDEKSIAWNPG